MSTILFLPVRCKTCNKPIGHYQLSWEIHLHFSYLYEKTLMAMQEGDTITPEISELFAELQRRIRDARTTKFNMMVLRQARASNSARQLHEAVKPYYTSNEDYFETRNIRRACCRNNILLPIIVSDSVVDPFEIDAMHPDVEIRTTRDWACGSCRAVYGAKEYKIRRQLRAGKPLAATLRQFGINNACCVREMTQRLTGDSSPISGTAEITSKLSELNLQSVTQNSPSPATLLNKMIDDEEIKPQSNAASITAPAGFTPEEFARITGVASTTASGGAFAASSSAAPVSIPLLSSISTRTQPTISTRGFRTRQSIRR